MWHQVCHRKSLSQNELELCQFVHVFVPNKSGPVPLPLSLEESDIVKEVYLSKGGAYWPRNSTLPNTVTNVFGNSYEMNRNRIARYTWCVGGGEGKRKLQVTYYWVVFAGRRELCVLDPRDPGQCVAFEKHREFMVGTRVSFSVFYTTVTKTIEPIVSYVMKFPIPMYSNPKCRWENFRSLLKF